MKFTVIDPQTGAYPDLEQVALNENWARHLTYCDMEGFFVDEYGLLVLADECGNYAYAPADRFRVVWEPMSQ